MPDPIQLPVYLLTTAGRSVTALSSAPVLTGDEFLFVNTGHEYLDLGNYRSEDISVTYKFPSTVTIDGQAVPDRVIVVTAHTDLWVGPFPPSLYNDADGKMTFNIQWPTTGPVNILVCALKPDDKHFIDLRMPRL